jgi:hypothetical protein
VRDHPQTMAMQQLQGSGQINDELFEQILKVARSWDHARGNDDHPDGLRGMCLELLEKVLLPRIAALPQSTQAANRIEALENALREIADYSEPGLLIHTRVVRRIARKALAPEQDK